MGFYRTKRGTIVPLNDQHVTDVMIKNLGIEKVAEHEVPKPDVLKKKGKKEDKA